VTFCYKELPHFPSVPKEFWEFNKNENRRHFNSGYDQEYFINDTKVNPCFYSTYTIDNDNVDLACWLKENIIDFADVYVYQEQSQGDTHIGHVDIGRAVALNYVIDPGGLAVATSWYQQKNKPLLRIKKQGGQLLDEPLQDCKNYYDSLIKIESQIFKPHTWYLLNVQIIHDVQNLTGVRKSISIGVKTDTYKNNQERFHNLLKETK